MSRPAMVVVSQSPEVREQFTDVFAGRADVQACASYDEALAALHGAPPPAVIVTHIQGQPLDAYHDGTPFPAFDEWLARRMPAVPVVYLRHRGARTARRRARTQHTMALPIPPALLTPAFAPYVWAGADADAIQLDMLTREMSYGGRTVALTPTEARAVAYLRAIAPRTASYDELMREVWQYEPHDAARLMRTHFAQIRGKIERLGLDAFGVLPCEYGVGYRWAGAAGSASPHRRGRPYSADEDRAIGRMRRAGMSWRAISRALRRSPDSAWHRFARLREADAREVAA